MVYFNVGSLTGGVKIYNSILFPFGNINVS